MKCIKESIPTNFLRQNSLPSQNKCFHKIQPNSSRKYSTGEKSILCNKDDEMENSTFAIKTGISHVCKNITDSIKKLVFSSKTKGKVDDLEDLISNFEVFEVQTSQKSKHRFEDTKEEDKISEVNKQISTKQMDSTFTELSIDKILGSKIVLQSAAEGSAVESSHLLPYSGDSPSESSLSYRAFSNYKILNSLKRNSCNECDCTLFSISINSGKHDREKHTDVQKESASNQISASTSVLKSKID